MSTARNWFVFDWGVAMSRIDINALLGKAGVAKGTADKVIEIDAMLQNWRRRAMRRELGHRALIDLKIDIDLAQLDVLMAIEASVDEFGDAAKSETMVNSVAERLAIDPSRASRVVAEMVAAGYARRAVSQADARRTIVELTMAGQAVVDAVRAYKFLIMGDFLSRWDRKDLEAFAPLLRQFSQWPDHAELGASKFSDEIVALAESISATPPNGADKP
jgi:DNA-binding MarR family transcriptional regulator